MKRDIDGSISHDGLLRYCKKLNDEVDDDARPPEKGPDHVDPTWLMQLKRRQRQPGLLGPMTTEGIIEGLITADGENAFTYIPRYTKEEIWERHRKRKKGFTGWYTGF